jgi:ABC-type multidrug transport system fused ATPase/permease subunit
VARDQSILGDMLAELTNSINYVKATGTAYFIYKKAKCKVEALLDSQWSRTLIFESIQPVSKSFGSFAVAFVVFMYVTRNYGAGENMLLPKLAIFLIALQRLSGKLLEISDNISTLSQNNGRISLYEDFLDLYDKPITIKETYASLRGGHRDLRDPQDTGNSEVLETLEIKDLSFAHPDQLKETLSCINMKLERGKVVGLVGHSGAGKSTLMNIISGIYRPTKGSLIKNGKEITFKCNNPDWWGRRIKLVSQEVLILNDTILENICFGEKFGSSRLNEVLNCLDLTQLVNKLPLGLDTVIGTGGYMLSGGERQRIGLARAFYKQGDLLLLDEPTSALDVENQDKANKAIRFFSSRWATLVITHSRESAMICDEVYKIEDGRIIGVTCRSE